MTVRAAADNGAWQSSILHRRASAVGAAFSVMETINLLRTKALSKTK